MATFIPQYKNLAQIKGPGGEREIIKAIANNKKCKDWYVLHSLNIASHVKHPKPGEGDFVIIIPNKGLVCLEVKSHENIIYDNGTWYLNNKSDKEGPFNQAEGNMYSILKYIKERSIQLSYNIAFSNGVATPFASMEKKNNFPGGIQWYNSQLIDKEKLNSADIHDLITNMIKDQNPKNNFKNAAKYFGWNVPKEMNFTNSKSSCEDLVHLLRPDLKFTGSKSSKFSQIMKTVNEVSKEQIKVIDTLIRQDLEGRIVVSGPAGSGKTITAIELAKRLSQEYKILYIIYNKNLINYLSKLIGYNENIKIINYDKLLSDILKEKNITFEQARDKSERLEIASEILLESNKSEYDLLIIDEAQDIPIENFDVFDLLLKNGLKNGKWAIFGDFKNQNIYVNKDEEYLIQLDNYLGGKKYTIWPFESNYRNTPEIAETIKIIMHPDKLYKEIIRKNETGKIMFYPYNNVEMQFKLFKDQIKKYIKKGIKFKDISILSCISSDSKAKKRDEHSLKQYIKENDKDFHKIFRNINSQENTNKLASGTIHSFKGMENNIIMITDFIQVDDYFKKLLYIGLSRSTFEVCLFHKSSNEFKKMFSR